MGAEEEFDEEYFDRLAAARVHWWVQGMQAVGAALLDAAEGGSAPGRYVLDAGCGCGNLLPWLGERADPDGVVVAVDYAPAAIASVRQTSGDAFPLQASVAALPLRDASVDLVVSMDVLQHLTKGQETEAIEEMTRVLRPGGRLLVRTNAALGRRRVTERPDWRLYRPGELRLALSGAGLEVERLTAVNFLQGAWASLPRVRRRHSRQGARQGEGHGNGSHHEPGLSHVPGLGIPAPVSDRRNRLLLASLRAEARWLSRGERRLPFGHSLYAVARRPLSGGDGRAT